MVPDLVKSSVKTTQLFGRFNDVVISYTVSGYLNGLTLAKYWIGDYS